MNADKPRILFHNSYPGMQGSQKIALQLLEGLPAGEFEAWAGAPFDTEFLQKARQQASTLDFQLPSALRTYQGGMLRKNPLGLLWLFFRYLAPFWRRASRLLRQNRIALIYAGNERCLFFLGIPARWAGIPVVWHIQSGFRRGRPWLHRLLARLATHVVAVSEAVRADAKQVLGERWASRIEVVHNGIGDLDVPVCNKPQNVITLMFAGSLIPEKGLHVLVEALRNAQGLPAWQLWVAGRFREAWYENRIRSMADGLPVQFLGFRDDLPALLSSSDILIVPSIEKAFFPKIGEFRWKEGFNLVALEGMRAGIPVIASATYGLKEVAADQETGLFFIPGNPTDLGEKLARLMADPALRTEMGAAGRKRFLQHFTLAKMQERFNTLFVEKLGKTA